MRTDRSTWISLAEARRRLGVGQQAMTRLIEQGRLTIRSVPHSKPRVLAGEVEALAVASTRGGRPCTA